MWEFILNLFRHGFAGANQTDALDNLMKTVATLSDRVKTLEDQRLGWLTERAAMSDRIDNLNMQNRLLLKENGLLKVEIKTLEAHVNDNTDGED